jgi:hypothetical protein
MDSSFNHIIFHLMDFWIGALLLDYACFFYIGLLFHFTVFQEHLEDKHLSQILLGIEAFAFYAKLDSDPPSGQGAAN